MAIAEFSVGLRIQHPSMSPEYICKSIDLIPKRQWKVGDQRMTPKGRKLKGIYGETYCVFKLKISDEMDLPEFIEETNTYLFAHRSFLNDLNKSGGKVQYYVFWYSPDINTGFSLDSHLLSELSILGVDFLVDIYGHKFEENTR